MEDYSQYSGEEYYRKPPKLTLPEIKLQGNEGSFKKVTRVGEEYIATDIGNEINGVILRVRRRLVDFKRKMATSEHNSPNDVVMLFGPNEKATAKDLRERYQTLRTQQVIYFLLNGEELVKLIVKGASLGSENKPKDSIPFYEYISSFDSKEHAYEFKTNLSAMPEQGKLGGYYAISFQRGEKLQDLTLIGEELKKLHEILKAQDEYYKVKEAPKEVQEVETKEVLFDENEIKPEDIGM